MRKLILVLISIQLYTFNLYAQNNEYKRLTFGIDANVNYELNDSLSVLISNSKLSSITGNFGIFATFRTCYKTDISSGANYVTSLTNKTDEVILSNITIPFNFGIYLTRMKSLAYSGKDLTNNFVGLKLDLGVYYTFMNKWELVDAGIPTILPSSNFGGRFKLSYGLNAGSIYLIYSSDLEYYKLDPNNLTGADDEWFKRQTIALGFSIPLFGFNL